MIVRKLRYIIHVVAEVYEDPHWKWCARVTEEDFIFAASNHMGTREEAEAFVDRAIAERYSRYTSAE